MMPLIEGLDGKNKMSKTLGNYIGIYESAKSKYQKVMEIPDELIVKYYTLLSDVSDEKIKVMLNNQGINIARRTVSKYREELEILPSSKRKTLISK